MLFRNSLLSFTKALSLTFRMISPLLDATRASRADPQLYVAHEYTFVFLCAHGPCDCRSHILGHDSEVGARDVAIVEDVAHDAASQVDWHGEAVPLVPARSVGQDRGVDA